MADEPIPTDRELDILRVLWDQQEATVREVYEELRQNLPIVQNTVQAFLRTMEDKGLVTHRVEGRAFIYRAVVKREPTYRGLASKLLEGVFDGAIDELVQSVFDVREPTVEELRKLEALIAERKAADRNSPQQKAAQ